MFFASEHLLSHIKETDIQAGYRTDHCQIHLKLKSFMEQRGTGLWKFNASLLEDERYSELIKLGENGGAPPFGEHRPPKYNKK